ncbi:MAG: type II toxin-antitoxin system HicB family antitoxin [Chlamydiia bacterium]|nr:type II toxin-antitoxin system HicB family antitoxin [Chlamydiia bacterium]
MRYHFKVTKEEDSRYSAECLELEGCRTEADSLEELHENMREALDLYIDEPSTQSYLAPLPNPAFAEADGVTTVRLDPKLAFALLLKHCRRKRKLTQEAMRDLMNVGATYSYQRLEDRPNASIEMIDKVKSIYPDFPLEEVFS